MRQLERKDFKEFETVVYCLNCKYQVLYCELCERPITTDETIFCFIKTLPNLINYKGKYHVCVECYEGENE